MHFFHSLFFKLLVSFILISIIPIIIIGYLIYDVTTQKLYETLEVNSNYSLEQKLSNIELLKSQLDEISTSINYTDVLSEYTLNSDLNRHGSFYSGLDQFIKSIENNLPYMEGITIINEAGFIYSYNYSLKTNISDDFFLNASWFPNVETYEEPTISPKHFRPYSNFDKDSIVYSYIYKAWDHRFKKSSYIIIDLNEEILTDLLNNNDLKYTGTIVLNHDDLIYKEKDSPDFKTKNLLNSSSSSILDKENQKKYFFEKKHIESLDWTVVEYFEEDFLFRPVNDIKVFFIWTIIFSVLVCIVISYIISRKISQPIYLLNNKMKEVKEGNLEQFITINSKGVIGDLTDSFNQMAARLKQLIIGIKKQEKLKRQAELTALQLQINPHFIYNTLESINGLARKKNEKEISQLIVLLGRLLRLSIGSFEEKISIDKELLYIKYYLKIQEKRSRKELDYIIDVESAINNLHIIKWILQPIVENGIIHGIDPCPGNGKILIKGRKTKKSIFFIVKDNGIGIDKENLKSIRKNLRANSIYFTKYKNKIGLYNVQARIHLYYGEEYFLKVFSQENKGTLVIIKIPLKGSDLKNE